jgi:tRNA-specific 2-thiouridylase
MLSQQHRDGSPTRAGPWPAAEDTHLPNKAQLPVRQRQAGATHACAGPPYVTLTVQMGEPRLREHLISPQGRGALAGAPHSGAAGGAACGDLVKVAVRIEDDRVAEAGFDASGCASARAAGSAAVALAEGRPLLEVARVTPDDVAEQLGGLTPGARHAAELAADALHRALGYAARDGVARLAPSPRRTLVAMSGGVDSAAAAQLALDAGDEVLAVTLELWSDPATDGERSCCSPQAVIGARALAHRMGIPHFTLDLRESFRVQVVDDFIAGYADGSTPNPCVRCNGLVRFDAMLALASSLGAARLATGHYARVARDEHGALVRAAADPAKDQSYMLARLDPAKLDRLSFPLGGLTKQAVRALARDAGLPVADKRESQDLCFVAGLGGRAFLRRHAGSRLSRGGEITDRRGRVLGRHEGQHQFTVGQRRGIGVAAAEPLYVLAKDALSGRVLVGSREELATTSVALEKARLYRPAGMIDAVKLRYRSAPIPATVTGTPAAGDHERLALEFDRPVYAAAPGQVACLLSGERVAGYGKIAETEDVWQQ